jgi:hypothetical protein
MHGMRSATQALLGVAFSAALVISGLACPFWLASMSHCEMPCPKQGNTPDQCPMAICLASAPRLVSHVGVKVPQIDELPTEAAAPAAALRPSLSADISAPHSGAPAASTGPIFLWTHALLI